MKKNQIGMMAFLIAIKRYIVSVVNDFKEAQRDLDEVRERMEQRSR